MNGFPTRAIIDLNAIRSNMATLVQRSHGTAVMAVVKANGYGHGAVPCALAALAGGATWVGVAQVTEALRVRAAIGGGRMLSWIYTPETAFAQAIEAQIDLGVSAPWALEAIAAAARHTASRARIHLKTDTGMGRAGVPPASWIRTVDMALAAEDALELVGCWSHFACADQPGHPSIQAQKDAFAWAVETAEARGACFEVRHLANSAALLTDAGANWDLIRPGLAMYGLSPIPDLASAADLGLRPAMRLESTLTLVKNVSAGQGVSYGLTYRTSRDTMLAIVGAGYGDGVPRSASGAGPVWVAGRRGRVAGRLCMDQFVSELGPGAACQAGDRVVLFGTGDDGEPTAEDWARAAGTIAYEIVTGIPAHVPREYVGG
ncbi:MAG: alanine racemase [Bifidobacteriaceae bacterium]|nr:alanine racemase [Bifidobacteriaceae bacterium]